MSVVAMIAASVLTASTSGGLAGEAAAETGTRESAELVATVGKAEQKARFSLIRTGKGDAFVPLEQRFHALGRRFGGGVGLDTPGPGGLGVEYRYALPRDPRYAEGPQEELGKVSHAVQLTWRLKF